MCIHLKFGFNGDNAYMRDAVDFCKAPVKAYTILNCTTTASKLIRCGQAL